VIHRVKTSLASIAILSTLAAGASCSGAGDPPTAAPSGHVQIYSWWVSGGEEQALTALLGVYTDAYPHVQVANETGSDSQQAQLQLQQRLADGNPPDAFQSNAGQNLIGYVGSTAADVVTKLQPLDDLAASEGWSFAPEVVAAASFGGHLYAVPTDISVDNALFYNVKLFQENGIAPPTNGMSWTDFFAMCDALQQKGITPIALGLQGGAWTWQLPVWEGVFAGLVGAQYYTDYFTGKKSPDDPTMVSALNIGARLLTYSDQMLGDQAATQRQWSGACDQVQKGKAAMTLMGDWARGYFESNAWQPGTDFGEVLIPAAQPVFVFSTDAFALPVGAPDQDNGIALLKVFGSLAGEQIFNPIKGSIPPRLDADTSNLDVLGQAIAKDFHTLPLASAGSILLPTPFGNALATEFAQFALDRNVDTMVDVISQNYDELSQ
jgi:glucose/mannose transport system substrate-binding protein